MSLIGKFVDKLLPDRQHHHRPARRAARDVRPGRRQACHGAAAPTAAPRSTSSATRACASAKLYMDGRLMIEDGTILDLLELIVGAKPWEDRAAARRSARARAAGSSTSSAATTCASRARNVAHHYDIGNELYALFLDDDLQYSCAYFTDPSNSLEQAQADKKAHIAAKLDLKPGQRVLDIGCGWGGMALYLHKVAGVEVLGHHACPKSS